MSFKAKFSVAGKDYRILEASYELQQIVDKTGRPSSEIIGGKIHVTVESTGETDLFDWMADPYKPLSGSLTFSKRDSDSTMKEVKFTDAYCVAYNETFSSSNETPMTIVFTLSAKKIEVGGVPFENPWAI